MVMPAKIGVGALRGEQHLRFEVTVGDLQWKQWGQGVGPLSGPPPYLYLRPA